MQAVFIIGSPRSGTTILGEILGCHPKIAQWYEPYYLWGKFFYNRENNIWKEKNLNHRAKRLIYKEFKIFSSKAKKPIVLDKSPDHAFNIKIINEIFPSAKWIHILRDGRDVALSIKKEWEKRIRIVEKKDFYSIFQLALKMLKRQPYWRYRFMALFYEIKNNASTNPLRYLNKSKWKGKVGWGPRFEGWEKYLQSHSLIEFNAMQWLKSVESIRECWNILPSKNKIEVRYENLITSPVDTLLNIFDVLTLKTSFDFYDKIGNLKDRNFGKWSKELSAEECRKIKPIIASLISALQYDHISQW